MRRAKLLVLGGGLAIAALACSSLLGIDDVGYVAGDASTAEDAPSGVLGDAADTQRADCGAASAPSGSVVFVAPPPTGAPTGCGTAAAPCSTIAMGITTLGATGGTVLVAQGTYPEALDVPARVRIEGGYRLGAKWTQSCDPGLVIVQSPSRNVTVRIQDGDQSSLANLSIFSKPRANPGESIYGLLATGTAGDITLDGVRIVAESGGDGLTGDAGAPGVPGAPPCVAEDGGAGAPGALGEAGASSFGPDGYIGSGGGPGSGGGMGRGGAIDFTGSTTSASGAPTCMPSTSSGAMCTLGGACASQGATGDAGCGGQGGLGAGGGLAGGSSIAIYVYEGKVHLSNVDLTSGNGGKGGDGGKGGGGGPGSPGSPGVSGGFCPNSVADCNPTPTCHATAGRPIPPGYNAGPGGQGGAGGQGGGGPGGASYALFIGPQAKPDLAGTVRLTHGTGGLPGTPNGVTGASGNRN